MENNYIKTNIKFLKLNLEGQKGKEEKEVPYTNNFYLKLKGSWYRKEFVDNPKLTELFNAVDRFAKRLGIDQVAIVNEMMLGNKLFEEKKYYESKAHHDNAQKAIYPLFQAMVEAGYDPQELIR